MIFSNYSHKNDSFTLIETLIVAAIIIIMTTGAVLEMSSFKNRKTLDLDAQQIATALSNAQSKAIQQEGGTAWGVRFTNGTVDSYQVFQGLSYSTSSVVDSEQLGLSDSFTNPASGMNLDVIFNQRTGTPVGGSAFVIVIKQNSSNNLYSIFVSSAGKVSTNFETGLVGYWPMDEGSGGTTYDASGNNNNGTITIGSGGTQTTVTQAWANASPSRVGDGLNFDGTDDYADAGNKFSLNIGDNMTVFFWINAPINNSYQRAISKNNQGSQGWEIQNSPSSANVALRLDTSAGLNQCFYINNVIDSTWHNIAFTISGGLVNIYVDGAIKSNVAYSVGNGLGNSTDLVMAAAYNYSLPFNEKLNDVRIYNRALSATEIMNLYNSY